MVYPPVTDFLRVLADVHASARIRFEETMLKYAVRNGCQNGFMSMHGIQWATRRKSVVGGQTIYRFKVEVIFDWLKMEVITTFGMEDWDWPTLTWYRNLSESLQSWQQVLDNPHMPWCWYSLSLHPLVTWQHVLDNPDLPWSSAGLSQNPNITWQIIQDNPDKPWNWSRVTTNPNITWQIVQDNPDKPWDLPL